MEKVATLVLLYSCVGLFWSCYAGEKQKEIYPNSTFGRMFLVVFLNYFLWPIAMPIAYFKRK